MSMRFTSRRISARWPIVVLFAATACGGESIAIDADALESFPVLQEGNADLAGRRAIALLFRPDDCPNILPVIERFNAADSVEGGGLTLLGVVDTRYRRSALKAIRAYDVRFTVLFDSLGRVREGLGARYRPTLVRTRNGHVETLATVGSEDRDAYTEIMRELAAAAPPR